MKCIIAGAVGTLAELYFPARMSSDAASFQKTVDARGARTLTTDEELRAPVRIC